MKIKYYNRPTLQEHNNFINRINLDFLTSPILKTITKIKEKIENQKLEKEFYINMGLVPNEPNHSFGVNFGYCVKNFTREEYKIIKKNKIPASLHDLRDSNIIAPALLNDDSLCRHIQIIGASGSGKTVLIKSLFYQNAIRGGGCFVVLGKGDNEMLQDFYSLACEMKREKDFFVFDFVNAGRDSVKENENKVVTNSISFFDIGGALELEQMIITLTKLDKPDDWGQKTVDLIVAGVNTLYILKESNLFFDVEKIDEIILSENKFETLKEYIIEPTGYQMLEYMTSYKAIFKLWYILEKMYQENPNLNDLIYDRNQKLASNIEFEKKYSLSERDKISYYIKKMRDTVADKVEMPKLWALVENDPENAFEKYIAEEESSQSALYAIGIAISKFGTLQNFFKRFELILNNATSDINILDGFRNNKLMVLNIPGQDQIIAPLLGKMITQILRKVNERYSNFTPPKETFMVFLDEINSWAKGGEGETLGVGDIMSVLRGAGISCAVAHQTSLMSMDSGKSIEQDQIEGNTNITILLKTLSPKIMKELNEHYKKEVKLVISDKGENKESKNASNQGIDVSIREENFFDSAEIEAFNPGQGYIIKNGKKQKFIVEMVNSAKFSLKKDKTVRIPINKRVSKEYFFKNFFDKEDLKTKEELANLEAVNRDFTDIENIQYKKPKVTKLSKQGAKFEKQLTKIYKSKGYEVIDGTKDDTFAEMDAEGVDLILKKDNEIVLVQAKNWNQKELGRDEIILICNKLENYFKKHHFNEKDLIITGLIAMNDTIKITTPAKQWLKDKESDPIFIIKAEYYKVVD